MDVMALFVSMIFSAIGTGYFVYGRKQQKFMPMLCGVVLGIYPYFISNVIFMLLVGAGLMYLPFLIDT
jgi:hypothetical protein